MEIRLGRKVVQKCTFMNISINTSDLLLARACHGYYFRFTAFQHERLYWLLAFRNTCRAETWREEWADMSCVVGRFGDFFFYLIFVRNTTAETNATTQKNVHLFWPGLESLLCTEDKRYVHVGIDKILALNLWRMCTQRAEVQKKKETCILRGEKGCTQFLLFLLHSDS